MSAPTFLDLFCGCGGFSLGMERAGFRCLAAIDFNPEAVATLRANFPHLGEERARKEDLTKFGPEQLAKIIETKSVDVIVGGPPCQGFSGARKVDGANHGDRLKEDARRHLYREFLRHVDFFKPRVFVMENVLGLRTAAGGEYFTAVQYEARRMGYRVHEQIEDSFALGVPQKRKRQLIIGVRGDIPGYFSPDLKPAPRARPGTPLGAAISDLPPIPAGGGEDECEYGKVWRKIALQLFGRAARDYLYKVLELRRAKKLTGHCARPHSDRDLRDFALLNEGESSAQAMRRGVVFEWPYSKKHFKDRYTRQSRYAACSTIVAHLSKDGLMFIHPWQNRSLTPREAARVQSFPDWFHFPVTQTHQFRLIGNAVPPLVSEAVGLEVRAFLGHKPLPTPKRATSAKPQSPKVPRLTKFIPSTRQEASTTLQTVAYLDRRQLRVCEKPQFLRGWLALLFLFPDLHPDNALDHGDVNAIWSPDQLALPGLHEFEGRRFARSGWPVALEEIGREARRRHVAGELSDAELYCAKAQSAGMRAQRAAARRCRAIVKSQKPIGQRKVYA